LCKTGAEIQAAHFGNHESIVIHQGVFYQSENNPISFATLSDDMRKTASAVAAHLDSIIEEITNSYHSRRKLFIFSDSPSSQYRNKNTIRMLCHLCTKFNFSHGFEWLYTEKGHGKSCADGVGAAIKRQADSYVARGGSLNNCDDLLQILSDSKIVLKKVSW
jgi:hypothetical protein